MFDTLALDHIGDGSLCRGDEGGEGGGDDDFGCRIGDLERHVDAGALSGLKREVALKGLQAWEFDGYQVLSGRQAGKEVQTLRRRCSGILTIGCQLVEPDFSARNDSGGIIADRTLDGTVSSLGKDGAGC